MNPAAWERKSVRNSLKNTSQKYWEENFIKEQGKPAVMDMIKENKYQRWETGERVGATPRHQIKQRPRTVMQDQETKLADVLNTFWSLVFLLRTDKFIFPIVDWICFINLSEIDISPLWCVAIERAPPACRYREIFLPRVCSLCSCLFTDDSFLCYTSCFYFAIIHLSVLATIFWDCLCLHL